MRRLLYTVAGLALLPLCHAALATLITLVTALRVTSGGNVSLGGWWLLGGFLLWILLYFLMPRPIKTYVLAHELTHAFWGLLMGARVSRLRVGEHGGSVQLSKTNFFITLAPYFFPFYTVLAVALHAALAVFYDLSTYEPFWLGLIGLTWAFHLTFTLSALMQEQPDVAEHGRVFSYTVILLLNLIGICLWLVAVGSPTCRLFAVTLARETAGSYTGLADAMARGWLSDPQAMSPRPSDSSTITGLTIRSTADMERPTDERARMEQQAREWIAAYRRGHTEALGHLVEQYRRPLYAFILRMMEGHIDAEEVFQEVWFRALKNLPRYRQDRFLSWLFRIAHNLIIDRVRRRKPMLEVQPRAEDEGEDPIQTRVADRRVDPGTTAAGHDLGSRIRRAVGALPAEQREVFQYRMESDLPFKEIARLQGTSINTALARMHYAVQKLRVELKDEYGAWMRG